MQGNLDSAGISLESLRQGLSAMFESPLALFHLQHFFSKFLKRRIRLLIPENDPTE